MTTIKNKLGLAFAALMAAGADDCSEKEIKKYSSSHPVPVAAHIIGYSSHDLLCAKGPRWEIDLEKIGHNAYACVPFRDQEPLNWSSQEGESYMMTLSPRKGPDGVALRAKDHSGNEVPVFNLDAIAAPQLPKNINITGRINLSYPSGANLCPTGEHLYGLRTFKEGNQLPDGHRRVLFCEQNVVPFDREVALTALATTTKDQVGRPVYRTLEVKVLGNL